jgi:hypothetical protein
VSARPARATASRACRTADCACDACARSASTSLGATAPRSLQRLGLGQLALDQREVLLGGAGSGGCLRDGVGRAAPRALQLDAGLRQR